MAICVCVCVCVASPLSRGDQVAPAFSIWITGCSRRQQQQNMARVPPGLQLRKVNLEFMVQKSWYYRISFFCDTWRSTTTILLQCSGFEAFM